MSGPDSDKTNRPPTSGDPRWKRPLDVACALVGLVLLSPVFALISLLIIKSDGRPVFYRGMRVGRGGRDFRIWKFRTMVRDADRIGGTSTPDDDPRLLKVGRILRDHKLDELPQLINVLRGEMSIVGPRPQVRWAVERYSDEERALLNVRPGLTDPASLRFSNEGALLAGADDPDDEYYRVIHPEKMRLSLEYVRAPSLATDLRLILRTAARVLGKGEA